MEFVFDLDDTLYPERDYAHSALRFLGTLISKTFGAADAAERLLRSFEAGATDAIGELWQEEGFPEESKIEFLNAMHEHQPEISLHADAKLLLAALRNMDIGFSIVTDGRSVTQQAKLAALGCLDAKFLSISEDVNIDKIDPRRFRAIEEYTQNTHYCYVGDNPKKDFFAPNLLGWVTVMRIGDHRNVHSQEIPVLPGFAPTTSVSSLVTLIDWLS